MKAGITKDIASGKHGLKEPGLAPIFPRVTVLWIVSWPCIQAPSARAVDHLARWEESNVMTVAALISGFIACLVDMLKPREKTKNGIA